MNIRCFFGGYDSLTWFGDFVAIWPSGFSYMALLPSRKLQESNAWWTTMGQAVGYQSRAPAIFAAEASSGPSTPNLTGRPSTK